MAEQQGFNPNFEAMVASGILPDVAGGIPAIRNRRANPSAARTISNR